MIQKILSKTPIGSFLLISAVTGSLLECRDKVMPWVYGPTTDLEESTWHRYEAVIFDQEADVIVAAGYSNFYGEYI